MQERQRVPAKLTKGQRFNRRAYCKTNKRARPKAILNLTLSISVLFLLHCHLRRLLSPSNHVLEVQKDLPGEGPKRSSPSSHILILILILIIICV